MKLIFLLILFFPACIPTNTGKRNFTTKPQRISVIQTSGLRTDGVYYGFHKNRNGNGYGLSYFFFYNNGVMRNMVYLAGSKDSTRDREWINDFIQKDVNYKDSVYGHRNDGGAFRMDSNFIIMQDFIYIPGSLSWDLRTYSGQIINDTVLYISSCQTKARPDYCTDGYYLKFIPMQKPDSTNRLMKKSWYWETN